MPIITETKKKKLRISLVLSENGDESRFFVLDSFLGKEFSYFYCTDCESLK